MFWILFDFDPNIRLETSCCFFYGIFSELTSLTLMYNFTQVTRVEIQILFFATPRVSSKNKSFCLLTVFSGDFGLIWLSAIIWLVIFTYTNIVDFFSSQQNIFSPIGVCHQKTNNAIIKWSVINNTNFKKTVLTLIWHGPVIWLGWLKWNRQLPSNSFFFFLSSQQHISFLSKWVTKMVRFDLRRKRRSLHFSF